ncbi:hypothetical protein IZ6_24770 [Terrihabitans soli]|uniref:Uncharacterized protein n=1 Tax=Terrihabitans soli TaxID=708113 RepID=A0A6S6QWX0_9HYPH|nr:hypothetical protein [Terrihabitans soli]BCJ91742.1 hypothetical protein IZ6_24770 [Terrihabitans soli]
MTVQRRTQAELIWAMNEWLKTTSLSTFQRSLISDLKACAERGADEFYDRAVEFFEFFEGHMINAIFRARREGVGRSWPANAEAS